MKRKWFAGPYLIWMMLFIVAPFIMIAVYSFLTEGPDGFTFTLANYKRFLDPESGNVMVLIRSLRIALISTVACLLLGYPVAYFLARGNLKGKGILSLLFIVPMWMNFLLRTYALMGFLSSNGALNSWANHLGFSISENEISVIIGMVYTYLPFMILPIYNVLKKMDHFVIEAAEDLGANRFKVFTKVVFPLSLPGVVSGITLVFMPAVSTFAIARILSGKMVKTFGDIIEDYFLKDIHYGAALSLILMVLVLISMAIFSRANSKDNQGGPLL